MSKSRKNGDSPQNSNSVENVAPSGGGSVFSQSPNPADVFESEQTRRVVEYAAERYGDRPEFLWPKYPRCAVFRRRDVGKWYAAILYVPRNKLGLPGDESVEILNLKVPESELDYLIDGKLFLPGYHMNKRRWFSICLDGSLSTEEIFERIDASYSELEKRGKR